MNSNDIDKFYVSPFDEFAFQFDADHSKSASQLKEIKKAQRIALLRDCPMVDKEEGIIWEGF